ncbi:MAG: hypothetical protein R3E52_14120 [Burkholderiaceae bacterium]
MKSTLIVIAALALPLSLAWAQPASTTAHKTKAKTTASATKGSGPAKTKPATRKPPVKTGKHSAPANSAKASVTPAATPAVRLTDAELAIAKRIDTGLIPCELGAHVSVDADEKNPGFFRVSSGKQHYYMHPVESRTGAIVLEDNHAGAMWLQLGNKSMLMNQKLGQRVADACASPAQRAVAAQLETQPQPALFDAPKP